MATTLPSEKSSAKLQIKLRNIEGALERLLIIIRQRGFRVTTLNMIEVSERKYLEVNLCLESERDFGTLQKKLRNCFDVLSVVCYKAEGIERIIWVEASEPEYGIGPS